MYAKYPADLHKPLFLNTEGKNVKRKTANMLELLRDILTQKMPDLFVYVGPAMKRHRCEQTQEYLDDYKKKYKR